MRIFYFILLFCFDGLRLNFSFGQSGESVELLCKNYFKTDMLCSELNILNKYYTYFDYVNGVCSDIDAGIKWRETPEELTFGPTLIVKLDLLINDITNKKYQQYFDQINVLDVNISNITSLNYNERRNAIHRLVLNTKIVRIKYDSSELVINDFDTLIDLLTSTYKTLNEFKKLYYKIYEKVGSLGFVQYAELFGFGAFEIETKLQPRVSKLKNIIVDKKQLFSTVRDDFYRKQESFIFNTETIIDIESEALNNYIDSLNQENINLLDSLESLKNFNAECEKRQKALIEDSINVVNSKNKGDVIKHQIMMNEKVINDLLLDEAKFINLSASKYNLCPNRESFEDCTHTDYKRSYMDSKNDAIKKLNTIKNRRVDLEIKTQNLRKALNKIEDSFGQKLLKIVENLNSVRIILLQNRVNLIILDELNKNILNLVDHFGVLLNKNREDLQSITRIK